MKSPILKALGALALAFIGAVAGGMLTTSYKDLRSNGESYVPALSGGLSALKGMAASMLASPWFYLPVAAILTVWVTALVTMRVTKPKAGRDPFVRLGWRMAKYVNVALHDKQYRRFSIYHETMKVCHEMEAFIVEIEQMGIPVPHPQSTNAEDWIDLCGDYLSAIGPYLRSGNTGHAIDVGAGFAERYPRR